MARTQDIFSADESVGLAAILDTLIPPSDDGRLPGAGELGLVSYLAERAPELQPLIRNALAALDARAAEIGALGFASLSADDRARILRAHADDDAMLVPALVFHVYAGYYQQQRVVEALGLEHRPPFPEGYPMEPTDPARLEAMRQRPPLYRKA